jgi:hypothetical protein
MRDGGVEAMHKKGGESTPWRMLVVYCNTVEGS